MSDRTGPTDGPGEETPNAEDSTSEESDPDYHPVFGSGSSSAGTPSSTDRRKKGFFRRHLALTALAAIFVLLAGAAGGYLWWLNHQFTNIKRIDVGIETDPKKEGSDNEKKYPLNILVLGADHGDVGQSVADDLEDGKWTPFEHRSDTIMLVPIPADRNTVELVSIPRDTWTKIDGYPSDGSYAKINAAFAYGGPSLAVKTVQDLTGITIDHLAIIDWAGFKDLTTALGGVRVYVPETFYDESQRTTWEQGWQTLAGERALQYVRTRYGLDDGDFDRIHRQQNFMRETMSKLLSQGTTRDFITLGKVVKVITSNLTVDDSWDTDEIRSLAWSLRDLGTGDVDFLTAPLGRYDTSADGQSIVRLAPEKSEALFKAVKHDNVDSYLKKYPRAELPGKTSVN